MQRLGRPGRHRARKRDQEERFKENTRLSKAKQRLAKETEGKKKNEGSLELVLVWKREIERSRWVRVIEGQMDN